MVVRLLALLIFGWVTAAQAQPLLVSDAQILALKGDAKLVRSLIKKCDSELGSPDHAVADFAPQPHYSATGANPDDGQAKGFTDDVRMAYRAALCFRISGDSKYAKHTHRLADAWANTLKLASTAQGRSDINFNVAQLVVAASWVQDGWNEKPFAAWLKNIVAPMTLSAATNNRGIWGNLLDLTIADFTNDKAGFQKATARWQELLLSGVADDGTMPMEICRSNSSDHCDGADKGVNGIAYTHYALLPAWLSASILSERDAKTLATPAGKKLELAFSKAAEFTAHPETFPYFNSNHGHLNKLDHCGYFALALRSVDNKNARDVLTAGTCKSDIWMLQKLFSN